ncbi:MAG: uracil-xanthine permease family protein [Clostridium sp.]
MSQYTEVGANASVTKNSFKTALLRGILGAQHLIAMFGATILVPITTGLDPSVALFSAGVGTLIFHLCTKGKVPVFLGSSFAFIPVILTVAEQYGDLRYAQGGMMIAGLIYVLFSFVVQKIGIDRMKSVLPSQVVGPMIIVIGVNLIPTALGMAGISDLMAGVEGASKNVAIAALTLGLALAIRKFGKGFISQLSIIIAVAIGYATSMALGLVNTTTIKEASLVAVPNFTFPLFDLGAIMIIVPVILAVFMEHIGDVTTNGAVVGKDFIKDPGLNRTLLGDGLATLFASLIGGPANTTYGENTGVLAMTKNYDPSILRITAVFAIGLSFIEKFGEVIKNIPSSVMGGISIILFSMIALIGVKTLRSDKEVFNTEKNAILIKNIIVIILIIGIGLSGIFLAKPITLEITSDIVFSGLSLAALVGITSNWVLTKIINWIL